MFSVGVDGHNPSEYYTPHGHGNATIPRGTPTAEAMLVPFKTALKRALRKK